MSPRLATDRLMQVAGLLTWAVVGLPQAIALYERPTLLLEARSFAWLALYAVFGVTFWMLTELDHRPRLRVRVRGLALVGLMSASTLGATWLLPYSGVQGVLLVIVASGLAHFLSLRGACGWIGVQTALLLAIMLGAGWSPANALASSGASLGFQLFALFATHAALSEARARAQLAQLNSELRATRALLAESSRVAERTRIARELHDLLGHHLTALSLNLEVAGHLVPDDLADGKAKEHVYKSHALAKLLLADVRDAVSTLRTGSNLDLGRALGILTENIPGLRVHLSLPQDLGIDDPARAQIVLRCAQEIITNTLRHAAAKNLWLEFAREAAGVTIHARDDGQGSQGLRAGHGLAGMRERLEEAGGRLAVASQPGQGFAVSAWLPLEAPA